VTTEPKKILIVGATSAIAKETARLYAGQGCQLFLVGRNDESLKSLAADIKVRGASRVSCSALDLNQFDKHAQVIKQATKYLKGLDIALICHGSLPDQQVCEKNFALAQQEINTNGLSVISMLTEIADYFVKQKHGTIAVITSVAGDRGRQSNYVYGSAKAMVSTYLQGLRGRLLPFDINVVDIRPGFVDSPMTAQFKKGPLWSSPKQIAEIIVKSAERKRHTVYAPFYWRFIMFAVRLVPEFLFKRIKL
jgi:decaprenylphospho-beta-D-erythro-pentofuranosid-2-ulose 2-reductase